jgi:hypothetical protein
LRTFSKCQNYLKCSVQIQKESHHPHVCVCGVFFTPNRYLSQNADGQDHVLSYKDSSIYLPERTIFLPQHPSTYSGIFLSQNHSLDLSMSVFSSLLSNQALRRYPGSRCDSSPHIVDIFWSSSVSNRDVLTGV